MFYRSHHAAWAQGELLSTSEKYDINNLCNLHFVQTHF